MKSLFLLKIIPTIFILLCSIPGSLQAATFNPADANQLQADLNSAAANGEDDTINLPANTLNTNDNGAGATFSYTSNEDNHLTIIGQGSDVSRLDGNNARMVMNLNINSSTAQVILTDLGIVNGDSASGGTGGGINITNPGGGVSISHCLFDNNNNSTGSFGLILISSDGPITIEDNVFSNSTAADSFGFGSIASNQSTIAFNRNVVSNIEATTGSFGGPNIDSEGPLTFNDNTISDITAGDAFGGGNINANSSVEFNRNTLTRFNAIAGSFGGINFNVVGTATVTQNTISEGGSGASFGGLNINSIQSLNFSNNTVQEINAVTSFGGGNINSNGPLTFNNNIISNNHAPNGFGGFNINTDGAVEMLNNTIAGNSAMMGSFGGLALNLAPIAALLANNIVVNNISQGTAAGMLINAADGTSLDFINNTFNGNASDGNGGGLFLFLSSDNIEANVYNNIIFGNTAITMGDDVYIDNSSAANATLRVFNNDFSDFCLEAQASCDVTILGANQGANIDAAPLFIDALAGNYYLGAGSPAIDAGTAGAPNLPATDHDGNPRIFGAEPDMGALESTPMILVDPLSHDFGSLTIDQEDSVVITITNIGSVTLDVSAMNLSDTLNYILNVSGGPTPCGTDTPTLNPGESCTVEIFFGPDAAGTFNAILTITSNDPNQTTIDVTLFGVGSTAGGPVFFSGGSCAFTGNLPASLNPSAPWILLALALGMFWYRRRRYIA